MRHKHTPAEETPIEESPVEASVVEAPAEEIQAAPQRTSVQRVVFTQIEGAPKVGRFLTMTVLDDQTVTLELDVPTEVAADVAAALSALESPLYIIQSA